MTIKDLPDVRANEHWNRIAMEINGHWSEKFNAVQRQRDTIMAADFNASDIAALCEHMTVLSEIVADLAQSMAEYHRWRQS